MLEVGQFVRWGWQDKARVTAIVRSPNGAIYSVQLQPLGTSHIIDVYGDRIKELVCA